MEDPQRSEEIRRILEFAHALRAPVFDAIRDDLIRRSRERVAEMSGDIRHKLRVIEGGRHD